MSLVKKWILAARPKTLGACITPVLMGGAMAFHDGAFSAFLFVVTLLSALFIQIGTNFANDYYDFLKGADTHERVGPTRATQAGWVRPEVMKKAFSLAFGIACILGVYLVYKGGLPIVMIGVLSVASGVLYTAGPYAIGYLGLSDVFVLLFFGPVSVLGTYYLQTHQWEWAAFTAGLAPGLLSVAIITVNNLRDVKQDQKANKKTLAVRFGEDFARKEYVLAIVAAFLIPFFLFYFFKAPFAVLFSSGVLILACPLVKQIWNFKEKYQLNDVLGNTGKLTLLFGVVFSLGYFL